MRASRRAGGRRRALAAGALVALAGCGETAAPPTATPGTPAASQSATAAGNLKAMIHGLIDRSGAPTSAFDAVVSAYVVNVNWSDIQATPGAPLAPNNAIDQAISAVRAFNATAGSHPLALKIRFFTGIHAPDWAKQLGGAPVEVSTQGVSGTVGRFWTDAFGSAYADVWQKLAAKYDTVPEIREITVSRCMTVYAETFVRGTSDPTTVGNLLNAGFSIGADQACIRQEIDLGKAWKTTRIGVAFNPYQPVLPGGGGPPDEVFTEQMLAYCRATLGPQCVLENNSLRYPPVNGPYQSMYAAIQRLGPPISFQTAAIQRVGDLVQTLQLAATLGADAAELPAGYQGLSPSALSQAAQALAASSG